MPARHGRVRFYVGRLEFVPPIVWDRIKTRPEKFDWRFDPKKLPDFITPEERSTLTTINDSWERNRELRRIVAKHMQHTTRERRKDIFKWIVKDWGGIRGGNDDVFPQWVAELSDFKRERIEKFFQNEERDRPSSWSKILSFIEHRYYPVYDARNAVALNIILEETDLKWRFFMPGTQNKEVPKAVEAIRDQLKEVFKGHHIQYAYYREYRNLLLAIKEHADLSDVLEVEMHLFAHSMNIIKDYIRENNLDVAIDEEEATSAS